MACKQTHWIQEPARWPGIGFPDVSSEASQRAAKQLTPLVQALKDMLTNALKEACSPEESAGVDEDQARELALQFVKSMLAGKKLVDQNGREVDLAKR
jgi:hypothetical protein